MEATLRGQSASIRSPPALEVGKNAARLPLTQELQADVVFEMDADFSHKPEDVPRLLAAIDEGADFVIGSRYVPGGTIPEEWGLYRRLNSRFGNIVARYLAGIYSVRDCTAGFRAIRTSILRRIDFDKLRVQGYAFQVALLHAAKTNKA
ncbi:MAG TPA: glycosyltransferase, partial [Zoogloea sp.]|nr:glycosyltransferase [Zoogloea sp.]